MGYGRGPSLSFQEKLTMRMILRAASAAALIAGLCVAAQADEVEDALKMALKGIVGGDTGLLGGM